MKIHMLDMGLTKYGDCLVIEKGNRRILVDGGHPGDTNSIRTQLKKILKQEAPFEFDLLIVTHCHLDHIGCLPDLVGLDIIRPKMALIADEKLGFGRTRQGDGPMDSITGMGNKSRLIPALEEEDHSDFSDEALIQFLDDAETLETKYLKMIDTLEKGGIKVLRYGSDITLEDNKKKELKDFEKKFADFALKILGPTLDHLVICAEGISNTATAAAHDLLQDSLEDDYAMINSYRRICNTPINDYILGAEDKVGTGAAKNNQSLVFKVSDDGWSALLAGDMQFAKPEVKGLNTAMEELLSQITKNGPYDFVKLTHHTAYNALDEKVYKAIDATKLFAHTGGSNDAGHPERGALKFLESISKKISFARNDRNGIISISKIGEKVEMTISKGKLNDFSPNIIKDEQTTTPQFIPPPLPPLVSPPIAPVVTRRYEDQFVEIKARVPHESTKVTITIDVQPGGAVVGKPERDNIQRSTKEGFSLGPGRTLPRLLLVSCLSRLENNIGSAPTRKLLELIETYPQVQMLDVPSNLTDVTSASSYVSQFSSGGGYKGIVIIGGYDVLASERVNVIDAHLRAELTAKEMISLDADGFLVWSDDTYGDVDRDGMPELPVSRIPDGKDPSLIFSALSAGDFRPSEKFGIRNYARPFAEHIYHEIPGSNSPLNVSEMFGPAHIGLETASGAVYYMLHGSHRDSSRFWGETSYGDAYEAVSVQNIPENASGSVVFTGCCWGALTVNEPASKTGADILVSQRRVQDSIALSYLKAGSLAFVGCTGSHYSPLQQPYNYYGKPMHDYFWAGINAGLKPSEALFIAKTNYARAIPHQLKDAFSRAIELKIFHQYTCLGFGW